MPEDGETVPPVAVTLTHGGAGGAATSVDGVLSTRRGNAAAWAGIRALRVEGAWDLTLSADAVAVLDDAALADILLVIGYAGTRPRWPT
jgi:hypothetical protein